MTREEELFGAALMLARRHGQEAGFVAAARIEEYLQAEEAEAVALWEEIAERIPLALERIVARPS
jgi:hypothetical protein